MFSRGREVQTDLPFARPNRFDLHLADDTRRAPIQHRSRFVERPCHDIIPAELVRVRRNGGAVRIVAEPARDLPAKAARI